MADSIGSIGFDVLCTILTADAFSFTKTARCESPPRVPPEVPLEQWDRHKLASNTVEAKNNCLKCVGIEWR